MELTNHMSSTEKGKTLGKQTPPVSTRAIKPIVEKSVDGHGSVPESPDLFYPNGGRSSRNKIMPEIEKP